MPIEWGVEDAPAPAPAAAAVPPQAEAGGPGAIRRLLERSGAVKPAAQRVFNEKLAVWLERDDGGIAAMPQKPINHKALAKDPPANLSRSYIKELSREALAPVDAWHAEGHGGIGGGTLVRFLTQKGVMFSIDKTRSNYLHMTLTFANETPYLEGKAFSNFIKAKGLLERAGVEFEAQSNVAELKPGEEGKCVCSLRLEHREIAQKIAPLLKAQAQGR